MKWTILAVVMFAFVLSACQGYIPQPGMYKVERIFMHRPYEYSFLILNEDGSLIQTEKINFDGPSRVFIFKDASKDSSAWICISGFSATQGKIQMHIHSGRDIEGGDYTVGKGQHQSTRALE